MTWLSEQLADLLLLCFRCLATLPCRLPQSLTKFIKKNAKVEFELPKKAKKDKDDDKDEDDKEVKDEL